MKKAKLKLVAWLAVGVLTAASAAVVVAAEQGAQQVGKRVRHELVTLPFYGVFDNLAYQVNGDTVTLYGQVVRPTTKSDAGRRVARIAGVGRVVNNIEVLPLSSFDDDIRLRTYRAVFNSGSLYRYAQGAIPSLHIIVNRGQVSLEGVVANETDKRLAYIAASGVPGTFSIKNNLQVERRNAY